MDLSAAKKRLTAAGRSRRRAQGFCMYGLRGGGALCVELPPNQIRELRIRRFWAPCSHGRRSGRN